MDKFTVVGVDGTSMQRYVGHFWADNAEHAEQQAYWFNPDLLVGGVFEGHLESLDTRASSMVDRWTLVQ